jgi:hypothetical protein
LVVVVISTLWHLGKINGFGEALLVLSGITFFRMIFNSPAVAAVAILTSSMNKWIRRFVIMVVDVSVLLALLWWSGEIRVQGEEEIDPLVRYYVVACFVAVWLPIPRLPHSRETES